jgi:xanthine phosphoribosyltransferase
MWPTPSCPSIHQERAQRDETVRHHMPFEGTAMSAEAALHAAIMERGRIEGTLLRVDDFLNHRVDPVLMRQIGEDLADRFRAHGPDLLLTAEASGIPPATACAFALDVPMVYAKKFLGPGDRRAFFREVVSPTRGTEYRVEVSRRVLEAGRRVLIIDDFLSGGRTAEALGEITEEAASEVVGFGFVIEKAFAGGRARLEAHAWHVAAIARVLSLQGGRIDLEPIAEKGGETAPPG